MDPRAASGHDRPGVDQQPTASAPDQAQELRPGGLPPAADTTALGHVYRTWHRLAVSFRVFCSGAAVGAHRLAGRRAARGQTRPEWTVVGRPAASVLGVRR